MPAFELQGHRGARGLKPENTLPAFERAIDVGVTTIETDVHLTSDHVLVLYHDARISESLCRLTPGADAPDPVTHPLISSLTQAQLGAYRADRNPDLLRFPEQSLELPLLSRSYAEQRQRDAYRPPPLSDLFAFTEAYAGDLGASTGKTDEQRERARYVRFDLELKRVPFYPALINDAFEGDAPGLLEELVVQTIQGARMVQRTTIRSFDHRCVRAVRRLEPRLTTAVLIAETAPVSPARLAQDAQAQIYCPDFRFLDLAQVQQAHAEGVRVIPWTVNHLDDWIRLLEWGVDGMTTDYPDRLAIILRQRGIAF